MSWPFLVFVVNSKVIVIFWAISRRPVIAILGNSGFLVDKAMVRRFFTIWNAIEVLFGRRFVVVLVLEARDVAVVGIIS